MAILRFCKRIEVDTSTGALWPLLADTDRINRALRLPPVSYETPKNGSLTRLAQTKLLGLIPVSWEEPPFEWVENQFYSVRRRFHGGLVQEIYTGVRLSSSDGKTLVEAFADVLPRNPIGSLAAKAFVGQKSLADFEKLCRGFEKALQDKTLYAFQRNSLTLSKVRHRELAGKLKLLYEKVDPKILSRLSKHILGAFDEEVVRMRPFALAERWNLNRLEVLKAFLYASRFGVLDVCWELLCPNCRVSKASYNKLADLRKQAHCETCGIIFDANFDRNVEVRFTVNAAIRKTQDAVFCIGGPRNTPHRYAQLAIEPQGSKSITLPLTARNFYVRSLRGLKRLKLQPDSQKKASPLELKFQDGEICGEDLLFRPGPVEIRLLNTSPHNSLWVALEEEAWSDQGATAALVTTLQEFRDLFSSEVLAPGMEIAIQHLAILFTDLKDSTALYEKIGNAKAYALVREHFRILTEAVRAHQGSVVKTIGDAVMAAFLSSEDAFRAALAIHEGLSAYNGSKPGQERIIVKLGIHAGATIAVNSNDILDYFGTTVNIAARIQSQSMGGDIVLSRGLFESREIQEVIRQKNYRVEAFEAGLRGIAEKFQLRRIWPNVNVVE